ncbi:MAG: hypothetical protein F9K41_16870, partial [Sphingopyxis terrae]
GFWGAAELGRIIGEPDILALDIGGTTAKCSLITGGHVTIKTDCWIERDGKISRIDYPAFTHAEANADMQALIVGQQLAAAPPRDMLLPLRIAVQLDAPASAPAPAASETSLPRT